VRRAPINQLELVVVYGNPLAETAVWRALANAGVPAVMLPTRGRDAAAAHGEVLGIEGQGAHAWFALVAAALDPAWEFTGRNRRPPRDPVNALLSLGYTLLGAKVARD
jgi:CRISPR/Cas system-associated endonuclease Cas1